MASQKATSAGLLIYRLGPGGLELFIGHMGGPFWAKKDRHAWSIPKGEYAGDEQPIDAARREFEEETGMAPPAGDALSLGVFQQSNRKQITIWAIEGDLDAEKIRSNTFTTEWPPKSGNQQEFPELDRAAWVGPDEARTKLIKGQAQVVDALVEALRELGRPT